MLTNFLDQLFTVSAQLFHKIILLRKLSDIELKLFDFLVHPLDLLDDFGVHKNFLNQLFAIDLFFFFSDCWKWRKIGLLDMI